MNENSVTETEMDVHLAKVQRETKCTLERFEKSGIKITQLFLDHFLKVTYERLEQTCRRYNLEAIFKIPGIVPEPMEICEQKVSSDVDQSKNEATPNLVKVESPNPADKKEGTKRRSNSPVNSEQSKRANITNNRDGAEKLRTIYKCVYCRNQNDLNDANTFSGTIDDVHDHWLAKHANEAISKPFQFYVFSSVGCFHCEDIGTYHELVKHHMEKHSEQQFAVVNRRDRNRCGVCHFNDSDLIKHFKEKHNPNDIQLSMIFNPIRYSEPRIGEFMKINVVKKRQCKKCNGIFETQDEIVKHFANSHNGSKVRSKEFTDKRNTPAYMMCGYCNKKFYSTDFLGHFRDHTYNFNCSQCPEQSVDIVEMIYHEKIVHNIDSTEKRSKAFQDYMKLRFLNTDIVFDNGLTLNMYNVLETKFDKHKQFEMFIHEFLNLMKYQAKKKIELKRVSQTQNRPTSQTSTMQTSLKVPDETKPSPSQIDSATAIRRSEHITELGEQRKLAKNVYIYGLSTDLNIPNPLKMFLPLCRRLKIPMSVENIEDIVQRSNGIIVKFCELQTKESFMSQTIDINIRSTELFRRKTGPVTRMIDVRHHMTPYFYHIFLEAGELKRQHLLHSYRLSNNGFLIKITANGAEHTVQSKQELMDLVKIAISLEG